MIRLVASLIVAACAFAAAPTLGQTLRPAATVAGSVIHLGDLFADAGAHAGDAVAPSPPLGMRTTYNADWLSSIAQEHGLAWSPGSIYDQVTVERASRVIGSDAIVQQMMGEIAARQTVDDAELLLDNPGVHLLVAADAPPGIAVDGLTLDRRSGRVSAFVSAPAGDAAASRLRVTGELVYRIEVPVPARPLATGAIIAAGDLDLVRTRRDRIGQDVATDPAQLIGRSARQPLQANEPVQLADVAFPVLVHKGELVTIVLETASLQLTAQGTALEDGAKDALVRVENTKSSRVIDAVVVGAGAVTVSAPDDTARTALR